MLVRIKRRGKKDTILPAIPLSSVDKEITFKIVNNINDIYFVLWLNYITHSTGSKLLDVDKRSANQ